MDWKKPVLAAIIIIPFSLIPVLIGFIGVQGSITGTDTKPSFHRCNYNQQGDLQCPVENEEIQFPSTSQYSDTVKAGQAQFTAKVDDVEIQQDTGDIDYKKPIRPYLYLNNYIIEDDGLASTSLDQLNTSEAVIKSLESASTCTLSADVAAEGEVDITTTQETQRYDDSGDRHPRNIMPEEVQQSTSQVKIDNGQIYCQFNFTELMNKGMELDGQFKTWSGRTPIIGDTEGSSSTINVNLNTDSDNDGTIDYIEQRRDTSQEETESNETETTPVTDPDNNDEETQPDNDPGLLEIIIEFIKSAFN